MTMMMQRSLRGVVLLAIVLNAALLVGCAQPSAALMQAGTQDRITDSDEPETRKRARVRLELATAYFGRGQLTTALDEVKQSISADATFSEAFNLRGLIYAALGDDVLADESFRRALTLDAKDADTMHNYGWYLCQKQRYDKADALFVRALEQPTYHDIIRSLLAQGVCQARAGRLAEAERALLRAYELDSANPATAVNLSEVLYRRGDLERARFYIERVNASNQKGNPQALWLAIRIEHRAGKLRRVNELGYQLRNRFPNSREAKLFERKTFDD